MNSADDRNHLLFVTLLLLNHQIQAKGSVYVCTKIPLHWYSFGGCSSVPILIIISYLGRLYMGRMGGSEGRGTAV